MKKKRVAVIVPTPAKNALELQGDEAYFIFLLHTYGTMTQAAILAAMNAAGHKIKDTRGVRLIKEQLIDKGVPVGSTHGDGTDAQSTKAQAAEAGYFLIKPGDMVALDKAQREYYNRAMTQLRRRAQLRQNYQTYYGLTLPPEQLQLFQEGETI